MQGKRLLRCVANTDLCFIQGLSSFQDIKAEGPFSPLPVAALRLISTKIKSSLCTMFATIGMKSIVLVIRPSPWADMFVSNSRWRMEMIQRSKMASSRLSRIQDQAPGLVPSFE
ncbi:hypothetical protein H2248_004335 [Termitomyces sp. 'cryptogamus']|nr:hypothetical protein H2248_004335 [Termitomyces sp. 'cryptogamus']